MSMIKTDVQNQFEQLVSKVIWPEFKTRNYRKTGNNFRIYHPAGWGKVVNIQKSAYSDRNQIKFTINTGLYLAKADTIFAEPRAEKFLEPDCLVRTRVGYLNGSSRDLWYELNAQAQPQQQVMQDVIQFVLPYLNAINSIDDIVQQILRERRPKSRQAIQAVFDYGYTEEASQWVEEEIANTIYRTWRLELEALRKSFNRH